MGRQITLILHSASEKALFYCTVPGVAVQPFFSFFASFGFFGGICHIMGRVFHHVLL